MAGRGPPGRNLLRRSAAERIVRLAAIRSSDLVVDVGAGVGALTLPLARRARRVLAVEPDEARAARLIRRTTGYPTVEVVRADALSMRWPDEPFRVIANPPFAITSALLRQLLNPRSRARRLDLVLGEGVVRLLASRCPGRALPLVMSAWWTFRYAARVAPSDFVPAPRAPAALLIAERRGTPLLPVGLRRDHEQLVGRALTQGSMPVRRQLTGRIPDRGWSRLAAREGFDRDARARDLSGPQWAAVMVTLRGKSR